MPTTGLGRKTGMAVSIAAMITGWRNQLLLPISSHKSAERVQPVPRNKGTLYTVLISGYGKYWDSAPNLSTMTEEEWKGAQVKSKEETEEKASIPRTHIKKSDVVLCILIPALPQQDERQTEELADSCRPPILEYTKYRNKRALALERTDRSTPKSCPLTKINFKKKQVRCISTILANGPRGKTVSLAQYWRPSEPSISCYLNIFTCVYWLQGLFIWLKNELN